MSGMKAAKEMSYRQTALAKFAFSLGCVWRIVQTASESHNLVILPGEKTILLLGPISLHNIFEILEESFIEHN